MRLHLSVESPRLRALWCGLRGHKGGYVFQLSPGGPRSEVCRCMKRWGRTWDEHGELVLDQNGVKVNRP